MSAVIDRGVARAAGGQEKPSCLGLDAVTERDAHCGCALDPGTDAQKIVVARRRAVGAGGLDDRQENPILFEMAVVDAPRAHQLGPPDLEPDEMIRVMRDAHPVDLGVSYPHLNDIAAAHVPVSPASPRPCEE